jgi:predicted deacetylase
MRRRALLCNPAQYLLRFDDLCPTVDRERWRQFADLLAEFEVCPILAVVPENCDPGLQRSSPDPEFWAAMRRMELGGATIALHGYRHICASPGRSLLRLARTSEFAGVDAPAQRAWIHEGLQILRGYGLNPQMWVAPRHGFDTHTLRALKAEGIENLSDGFSRKPYLREGITWIPQQLWSPVEKSRGLWTICIHPNTAGPGDIDALRSFVRAHRAQFTSVDRVLAEFPARALTIGEALYATVALARIRVRQWRKQRNC